MKVVEKRKGTEWNTKTTDSLYAQKNFLEKRRVTGTLEWFFSSSSPWSPRILSQITATSHIHIHNRGDFRPPSSPSHTSNSDGKDRVEAADRWWWGEDTSDWWWDSRTHQARTKPHTQLLLSCKDYPWKSSLDTHPLPLLHQLPGGCIMMNDVCITGRHH